MRWICRSGYASSDFDRTHVFNFNYLYELPKFAADASTPKGWFVDGWAIQGVAVFQSGQPFSVIDYSGAIGSIYYGVNNGISNPVVPVIPGCKAVTGHNGVTPGLPALNANCFTLPILRSRRIKWGVPVQRLV